MSANIASLLQSLDNAVECGSKLPWNIPNIGRSGRVKVLLSQPVKRIMKIMVLKLSELSLSGNHLFTVKANTFFNYSMTTHVGDIWLCGSLLHLPEARLTKYIIQNVSAGDVVFDIGANHGFYTLLAYKLLGGHGEVHAFEPADRHFKILKENVKDRKNITINKLALHSHDGVLKFYVHGEGSSTLDVTAYEKLRMLKYRFSETEVLATTLDRYCKDENIKPTFLKIDVEGAEYEVLVGARRILTTERPKILMEIWRSPFDYENHLRAIDFLLKNDYKPFRIDNQGLPAPITEIIPDRDISEKDQSDNFLFMKA
jgi:FkbM family methyltransferase